MRTAVTWSDESLSMGNTRDSPSHNPISNMSKARDTVDAVKRERKSNFIDTELSCLLEQYSQHATILQCKLRNNATNLRKKHKVVAKIAYYLLCGQ